MLARLLFTHSRSTPPPGPNIAHYAAPPPQRFEFVLRTYSGLVIHLFATTEEEYRKWIGTLNEIIARFSVAAARAEAPAGVAVVKGAASASVASPRGSGAVSRSASNDQLKGMK